MSNFKVNPLSEKTIQQAVKFSLPHHLVLVEYRGNLTDTNKRKIADVLGRWIEGKYASLQEARINKPLIQAVGDGWISGKEKNVKVKRYSMAITEEGKRNESTDPSFAAPDFRICASADGEGWGSSNYDDDQLVVLQAI